MPGGKLAKRSSSRPGSSTTADCSSASCKASLALESSTASSGRVRPRPSAARRAKVSASARPSVAASSPPASSSTSIRRMAAGTAATPPASAMDKANACKRLSSSTRALTSSVMLVSSATRPSSSNRPARLALASAILMLTSLSEQSTPAELSMKSGLSRPPLPPAPWRPNSIRPAWVQPRLPPSPITRARTSRPSTRMVSLAWSPTAAFASPVAFTYVPMPPNHNRSTGAARIARISASGSAVSAVSPSARRTSGESGISFWLRGNTPPPAEISDVS